VNLKPYLALLLAGLAAGGAGFSVREHAAHARDSLATWLAGPQPEAPSSLRDCNAPVATRLAGQKGFTLGANYPWLQFGADFGGLAAWGLPGVDRIRHIHDQRLAELKQSRVNVLRWWMFPDLRGDGLVFDADGAPQGLGESVRSDLLAALELAASHDMQLMPTLFSHRGFCKEHIESGLSIRSMSPLLRGPELRARVIERFVVPILEIVASSPHRDRVLAWDIMNEPEWATSGRPAPGAPPFAPNLEDCEVDAIPYADMRDFLSELITAVRARSAAQVTVGTGTADSARAFASLATDFHQLHVYDSPGSAWPPPDTPEALGLTKRPVLIGEFGAPKRKNGVRDGAAAWLSRGFAGALLWQDHREFGFRAAELAPFAEESLCEPGRSARAEVERSSAGHASVPSDT
jgi:hypothetical protein